MTGTEAGCKLHGTKKKGNAMSKEPADYINLEKIKTAYQSSAKIFALYGDRYLPLFERMHQEMKKAEASFGLKSLALEIVRNESTHQSTNETQ